MSSNNSSSSSFPPPNGDDEQWIFPEWTFEPQDFDLLHSLSTSNTKDKSYSRWPHDDQDALPKAGVSCSNTNAEISLLDLLLCQYLELKDPLAASGFSLDVKVSGAKLHSSVHDYLEQIGATYTDLFLPDEVEDDIVQPRTNNVPYTIVPSLPTSGSSTGNSGDNNLLDLLLLEYLKQRDELSASTFSIEVKLSGANLDNLVNDYLERKRAMHVALCINNEIQDDTGPPTIVNVPPSWKSKFWAGVSSETKRKRLFEKILTKSDVGGSTATASLGLGKCLVQDDFPPNLVNTDISMLGQDKKTAYKMKLRCNHDRYALVKEWHLFVSSNGLQLGDKVYVDIDRRGLWHIGFEKKEAVA